MDTKTEIVALAVRVLSKKTDLVRPNDTFTELLAVMTTGKSQDVRTAEQIIASVEGVVDFAKKTVTNRKFKKITKELV